MGGCSAINCANHSRKKFRLFKFPREPERRKKWIVNCRRQSWEPGPSAELCEVHFEDSQFESHRADGWRKLKPNAIPTLFDVPNPPKELTSLRQNGIGLPKSGSLLDPGPSIELDVCELHFKYEDVMRHIDCFDEKKGKRWQVRLDVPRLRPGAVPVKLPECTDVPRSKIGTARKRPLSEKQREGAKAIKKATVKGEDKDQCKAERLKNVSTPKVSSVNEIKKENNCDVINECRDEISIEPERPNVFETVCFRLLPIKDEPLEIASPVKAAPLENVSERFEVQSMNCESGDSNACTTQLNHSSISCKICHISFQENSLLIEHLYTHIRNQPKTMIDMVSYDYQLQQSTQLSNAKNFVCDACGASFHMEFLLENHCVCHLKNIDFACEFCGETFESQSLFEKHHKLHIVKPSFEKLQKLHVVKPSLEDNQALLIVEPSFEKLQKLHVVKSSLENNQTLLIVEPSSEKLQKLHVVKPSLENNHTLLIVEPSFEKLQKLHVVKPSFENNQTLLIVEPSSEKLQKLHVVKPSLENNQTLLIVEPSFEKLQKPHVVKPSLDNNQTLHVLKPSLENNQTLHVVKPLLEKNQTLHVVNPLLEKHQELHVVKPSLEKNQTLHIMKPSLENNQTHHVVKPLLEKHQELHVVKPSLEKDQTLHIMKPSFENHQKLHIVEPNVISKQGCKTKEQQPTKSPFLIYVGYKDEGGIPKHNLGDEQNSDSDETYADQNVT